MKPPTITCPNCKTRIALSPTTLERLTTNALDALLATERAALARKARQVDSLARQLNLKIEKGVENALAPVRQQARAEAEASLSVIIRERELQLAGLRQQINDLKQRAEQGSQQLQGEAQERDLEEVLAQTFPLDRIEPIAKGKAGADIVQHVTSRSGGAVGTILWESKRTRRWSGRWLAKLAEDQRRAKADAAVIVSRTLPKELEGFALMSGIWVTRPTYVIPIATALRQFVLEVGRLRHSATVSQDTAAQLHRFITGAEFRRHVGRIIEQFAVMKNDLEREQAATARSWAKREAQILAAVESTAAICTQLEMTLGNRIVEHDTFPDFRMIEGLSR